MSCEYFGKRYEKNGVCLRKNLEYPPTCVGADKCIWDNCHKVKTYKQKLGEKYRIEQALKG